MPKPISKTTLFTPSDAPFILDPSKPVLTHARDMQAETGIEPHSHPRSQLLWAAKGVLRVRSDTAVWVVPSTHAVWIPSGLPHQVVCETLAHTRNLYIDPSFIVRAQDEKVVMVSMSSLMREIILRLTENVQPYRPEALHRLGLVAIDELEELVSVDTHLPAGSDPRLSRVIQRLIREPQANFSLAELAEIGGASIRTIERLFKSETGLTYRQWRQRFRLLNALEKLHQGGSTTAVAHDLGYLSVSSFSAAFKAEFGRTPQEYASHRTLNNGGFSACSKAPL
ncbi:AraC family transcriptional regulator [Vibrio metoecus]|uniref:AraC family transcriptional regulator n=1 Tax=Vibrio metoecus TaxID=1481663 RepID=A0A0Q0Q1Q8_VIBMT|nr:helix-turn-helix transcriptional regulator [Vibrio metoecus]KQB03280.1 AraC family transcriptional regulator [Vibrio metoecus]PAR36521.1 AraC family transcriptional regulator [Vibrio metoecus]PAR39095.1 AraC family transcriptional regulator [Vibrio metoecus]PAR42951.1 AraC family transcriptional regulator [Vibrio metoecus]